MSVLAAACTGVIGAARIESDIKCRRGAIEAVATFLSLRAPANDGIGIEKAEVAVEVSSDSISCAGTELVTVVVETELGWGFWNNAGVLVPPIARRLAAGCQKRRARQ